MDKRVKSAIVEYYHSKLFPPERTWPEYYFKCRSYSRWAAKEILRCIRKNPDVPATETVEGFIYKLDSCSELAATHWDRDDQLIFVAARETATDILDILTAMR